ncbi:3-methyl-2-oxobutanoate hydroxymethyltransferase [candidate division WOR-1 bacterium RIFOXYA12_FULL_43_27]|uniref:3-methyl-2-oxobutanoate hydroxymethyltransferase n=1 Tax=candidate division WOR-1 bacterium RIFOXYC2_FULL_46_14 TaxID=1802587 RepID=A0A1F4U5J2_UNCSA|nr:MAG: 3-methyl-2-oxobutanoate hydroxymethyltransferase [candidate division WOR-1 bacterium RIFOXYA12_FULL_43_27]OGC20392.1 MAG: 3-methyl-2-oxobutanoate hydroxymethyltransferase [candidate division WOR-1 bacterium RIFOXYB2_FULL_46_45]OGC31871.1 MAG: 3-methyl-2-oxobutanoate hydroxymethyltransferase [candidate division WOR-1 bacterium RIFOXYA2_FULL_46_56]OGC40238.1 MAG: 3-methyl-2-oxobutanoate hydroxymethyltransferase [candidate division WOR-1 bacterium RIFOXYC2_FULL_46_14]
MEKTQTAAGIKKLKGVRKISMLTAYDSLFAKILDETGIDIILVGDSLGNVALGYKNTVPVTLMEMVIHTQAVARVVQNSMIVADLPFGTFQQGVEHALCSAVDLIKAGANAVKLEGAEYTEAVKAIVKAGIPVVGHLGFTPQSVNQTGFKCKVQSEKLKAKAKKLEQAGCFAVVLEMVDEKIAAQITKALKIPTIGIGSGSHCDGQVLVTADLLGLYENPPKFVKKRSNLRNIIKSALIEFKESI